jgi:hypothetical protein
MALVGNPFTSNNDGPFVLDDLGCSGSEGTLLQCLPDHNCGTNEDAGVRCQRKGISIVIQKRRNGGENYSMQMLQVKNNG